MIALVLLAVGAWMRFHKGDSAHTFGSMSFLRIGIVFGVLWLAWPSLRRPAQLLAPGLMLLVLLGILVVAAQPRLILAVGPVVGVLVAAGAILRTLRWIK